MKWWKIYPRHEISVWKRKWSTVDSIDSQVWQPSGMPVWNWRYFSQFTEVIYYWLHLASSLLWGGKIIFSSTANEDVLAFDDERGKTLKWLWWIFTQRLNWTLIFWRKNLYKCVTDELSSFNCLLQKLIKSLNIKNRLLNKVILHNVYFSYFINRKYSKLNPSSKKTLDLRLSIDVDCFRSCYPSRWQI